MRGRVFFAARSTVLASLAVVGAASPARAEAPRQEEGAAPLRASLSAGAVSRRLSYEDDLFGRLRRYTLDAAPAALAELDWYPGAHFTSSWPAHIGLGLSVERLFAVQSDQEGSTSEFDTSAGEFAIGLRARVPIDDDELALRADYGTQSFTFEPIDETEAETPSVDYRFVQLGLRYRWNNRSPVSFEPAAGARFATDTGGIESAEWFPRASARGAFAELRAAFDVGFGAEPFIALDWRRWVIAFDPRPGDDNVAGGAADDYLGVRIGLQWRGPVSKYQTPTSGRTLTDR